MSISPVTEWIAEAVQKAVEESGRSKTSISDETGIPYSTLNRKLSAKGDFSFVELFLLSKVLGVHPSRFTPPQFSRTGAAA